MACPNQFCCHIVLVVVPGFISVLFLFRFSRHTRNYIHNSRPEELTKAFRDLRLFFVSTASWPS
jgi:hypothetical protein